MIETMCNSVIDLLNDADEITPVEMVQIKRTLRAVISMHKETLTTLVNNMETLESVNKMWTDYHNTMQQIELDISALKHRYCIK